MPVPSPERHEPSKRNGKGGVWILTFILSIFAFTGQAWEWGILGLIATGVLLWMDFKGITLSKEEKRRRRAIDEYHRAYQENPQSKKGKEYKQAKILIWVMLAIVAIYVIGIIYTAVRM